MLGLLKCVRTACAIILLIATLLSCRKSFVAHVDADNIIETKAADLIPVTFQLNASFGGYYIQLPHLYKFTRKNYPVIIFFHGLGQMGNGSTDLHYVLNDGIGKLMKANKMPLNFPSNGENYSFIVVSPQTSKPPTEEEAWQFVEYIVQTYRCDLKHMYVSGLSLGSRVATLVGAAHPRSFAAMLAIAGVALNEGFDERCRNIAGADLPVWEFHNADDPLADVNDAKRFISTISGFHPDILPRITIFDVYGHDAWTTALDPHHREDGMNVYEWMLQYSR